MSKPYMISYDLNDPGQKYEDVKKQLRIFLFALEEFKNLFGLYDLNLLQKKWLGSLKKC